MNDDAVRVAWPELSALVASAVAPSLKMMVPVGVPAPGAVAVTVAVKITDWLKTDGLADEVSTVVELARLTFCAKLVCVWSHLSSTGRY